MKNKTLRFIALAVGLALATPVILTQPGCHSVTVDPAGVYLGDVTLYQADQIVAGSADALTAFVKWEHLNRAALAGVPAIRKLSTDIDLNAKQWIASYFAVRDAYVAAPSSSGKLSLTGALQVIQTALAQAAIYLSQPVPQTLTPAS